MATILSLVVRSAPAKGFIIIGRVSQWSSSAGDGPGGVIHLFPFLIRNFLKEGWPLNELLAIQKKRISEVIRDMEDGNVTVSSGHYHSIDELAAEILEHVSTLQKLALRSQA